LAKVSRIKTPALFIHGRLDRRIPIDQGRRLFEAAPEPKEWLEVPGADHNDVARHGRLRYWLRLSRFRDRCLDRD
jgi:dipeptidyl aminopeptidase/acylaminoacyl peptidase